MVSPDGADDDATVLRPPVSAELYDEVQPIATPTNPAPGLAPLQPPTSPGPVVPQLANPGPATAAIADSFHADAVERTNLRPAKPQAAPPFAKLRSAEPAPTSARQSIGDHDRTARHLSPSAPPTAASVRKADHDKTVRRQRAERQPGELNLWDDYGIADQPSGLQIDTSASRREQVGQLLGATALPTAKTFSFLAVLGATILVLLILVSRLVNMDEIVLIPASPSSTAAEAPSEAPVSQAPPETTSAPVQLPKVKQTPAMLPGAKQCDPGVWAGSQTSCALANEVAQQVRLDMTGTVVVEAFSSSSNRNYKLECVAGEGITCTGLEGVQGVYVWLVTEA